MHGAMSAAALLGPGRSILVSGFRSAARGAPDMNSLVSLGAVAAFSVSCVAAAMPQLAWRTFFEEPAMLLGVVLMGRTLEQRAKLQASSDMVALRVSVPAAPTKNAPLDVIRQTLFFAWWVAQEARVRLGLKVALQSETCSLQQEVTHECSQQGKSCVVR